jgi:peptidyl-prolyl cis-trans isomerase D
MLGWMRKQTKSRFGKWFMYIAFGSIIIVFVFFYGYGGKGDRQKEAVALVNDQEISRAQYDRNVENLMLLSRNIYQKNLSPEEIKQLRQRALDELVDRTLLLQEAEKRGVAVSPDETKKAIANTSVFQREGVFEKKLYLRQLAARRIGPNEFEKAMRAEMLISKTVGMVQDAVKLSDEELFNLYRLENEKANLRFVKLNAIDFEDKATVAPEEVKAFYESTKDRYKVPPKAKVRYLSFDPKSYQEKAVVPPEKVEEFYRVNIDKFMQGKKVKARHILIEVKKSGGDKAQEEARAKAEEIKKKIDKGDDFSQLAKKFSQDKATASKGGDLGYFERGQMVKPLEAAAFSLKPGEVSAAVRTPQGFDIIKAEEVLEARTKPLEEVRGKIEEELKTEKAAGLVKEEARSAASRIYRSGNLIEYADKNGLKVHETAFFSEGEPVEGVGINKGFSDAAFLLEKEEVSPVIGIGEKYFILQQIERKASYVPALEEVSQKVEKLKKREAAGKIAKEKAGKLLEELASGSAMDALAKREGLTIEETGFFSRKSGFIGNIGYVEELAREAFSLTRESPFPQKVYEAGNRYFVIELKEREEASRESFQSEKVKVGEDFLAQKKEEAIRRWLNKLREEAQIEVLITT